MSDYERITTLARYLRSQVALANRPPVGRVELNNEEATVAAEAMEELAQQLGALENPIWRWSHLAEFFKRHALISKAEPKCFVCEGPSMGWPPAKQHPDLPNVIVCERCLSFATAPRMKEPI